jgi:hypothetical protein
VLSGKDPALHVAPIGAVRENANELCRFAGERWQSLGSAFARV